MGNTIVIGRNKFRVAWDEVSAATLNSVGRYYISAKNYSKRARGIRISAATSTVPIYHYLYGSSVGWIEFDDHGEMQVSFEPGYEHLGA
jgi:hypothetical protein